MSSALFRRSLSSIRLASVRLSSSHTAAPCAALQEAQQEQRKGLAFSSVALAGALVLASSGKKQASCQATKSVKIGDVSEFQVGEMYEVEVASKRKIIVTKDVDGKFYAIGSKCSHYGYPLIKGVQSSGKVVCPLHDAAFDVKSGKPIRGPGLDAIPSYPVDLKGEEVWVTVPADSAAFPSRVNPPMVKRDPRNQEVYLLVGGGAASVAAAQSLREEGYTGRIVIASAERHLPYDRPTLSKKFDAWAQGDAGFADAVSKMLLRPASFYEEYGIEVWLDSKVTKLDADTQVAEFDLIAQRPPLKYDKCLVATGGRTRKIFVPGSDLKNIFTLRCPEDAEAIEPFCQPGYKIVVVGGSFIGMETASALAQKGADVTIISQSAVPFERVLGKKIGAYFANFLGSHGVRFMGNTGVKLFRGEDAVLAVELDDGDVVAADAVVLGTGVIPVTDLLEGVKKAADGSVPVTPLMSTRSHPSTLFAAGDIATFPDVKSGEDLRIEHWDVAMQQGRVAGKNMAGKVVPYSQTPFFWTMLFGKSLRYVGRSEDFDNVLIEGDMKEDKFVAYYVEGDDIKAVATVGRDPVAVACAELIAQNKMPKASEILMGICNSDKILEVLAEQNRVKKSKLKGKN